jgi:transposase
LTAKGKQEYVIDIAFTEKDIEQLKETVIKHPHPFVRRKALVLLLKSQGSSSSKISATADICENTVRNYLHAYQEGGINKLSEVCFYRPESELKSFDEEIKIYCTERPPATIKQACAEIAELTGIAIKETQMRHYLKSMGLSYKKVAAIPAKADIQAQQTFKENQLEPRLAEAKTGKRDVYFLDAAHFVLGAFLGFLWSFTRVFVKTPSGRQRFNVLGALNAITHELTTVTNTTYITATEVCKLLRQLARNATKPITIVLDNARYQRCAAVTQLAKELNIELLFLPPYSPNLNLIERLWKLVKKRCLNSRYHSDFQQFQHVIMDFLEHMHQRNSDELDSLLTLNFQTFTNEQILKAA